jgi:transcriptional regulator with XRE-family HTH domain
MLLAMSGDNMKDRLETRDAEDRRWFAELVRASIHSCDKDTFASLIDEAINKHRVAVAEICAAVGDGKGTVSRWKNGITAPGAEKRQKVLEWLYGRLGGSHSPAAVSDTSEPALDFQEALGFGIPVPYRRGVRLEETIFVDFTRYGDGLCVYLPEEANRLRLGSAAFNLRPLSGTRAYLIEGLTANFFHEFRSRNADDPLCHFLDWDVVP